VVPPYLILSGVKKDSKSAWYRRRDAPSRDEERMANFRVILLSLYLIRLIK